MPEVVHVVSEAHLKSIVVQLLRAVGMSEAHAARAAYILVTADLRGVTSHGVRLLPGNIRRILGGAIKPQPEIRELRRMGGMALMDGDSGLGMTVGAVAMERAIALAREHGIGWVTARNSCHYGASGAFVMQAIEAGMLGASFSNTLPMMTIEGTNSRVIGNNPFAIGAPGPEFPLVLDMATSVASLGKMYMTRRAGKPIPSEWLAREKDESGRQVLRHFGGAKGSGLAIFTEIFTSVIANGAVLGEVRFENPRREPEHVTHTQVAIRPDVLVPREQYDDAMRRLVAQLKAAEPAPGVEEVLLPGERAWRETVRRRREGIPIEEDIAESLEEVAKEIGVRIEWG